MKSLYIAEKPSVAQEFARALKISGTRKDGYLESETAIVTWCVGHLVTMSYPEAYDPSLKRWSLNTLPFIPDEFKYEIIPSVKKQFAIVSGLLNRPDVGVIYVCTDSGREGEYIYRLVEQMAGYPKKERRRVWIDSQTEEEILRGIREAKDLSEYDALSSAAYLRAKEDYLMGINFSRLLTLKYGPALSSYMGTKYTVLSVGRVMTCVLGMVVRREREIRNFVKTPFYRVLLSWKLQDAAFDAEWHLSEGSAWMGYPKLYKENGFLDRQDAGKLVQQLNTMDPQQAQVLSANRKQEKKYAPLLYNLAELQNECSKMFKISPDETLAAVQELYEKKLVTYPRTDARVLSSAVAKEISRNLGGLTNHPSLGRFASEILSGNHWQNIAKTRYVDDKQITDHYAIIPTGQTGALPNLHPLRAKIYDVIVQRFLSIFYPPAIYQKVSLTLGAAGEEFVSSFKVLTDPGYLVCLPAQKDDQTYDTSILELLKPIRKGSILDTNGARIKEGETTPPKRYSSGSMILAMENAGQLIEDEDLRAQIRGSGIGTSATRAEILKKLVSIKYLNLNKKTQIITPAQLGEMVYEVVEASIRSLLNPDLTASWEKGLTYVANADITPEEYMEKLTHFIRSRTQGVLGLNNQYMLRERFDTFAGYYKKNRVSNNN